MDFGFFDSLSDLDMSGSEHSLGSDFHTEPNIFGGENIFDQNNHQIGHTESNIFGGNDIYGDAGSIVGQTTPNIFGGVDVDLLKSFNPTIGIPDFNLDF